MLKDLLRLALIPVAFTCIFAGMVIGVMIGGVDWGLPGALVGCIPAIACIQFIGAR